MVRKRSSVRSRSSAPKSNSAQFFPNAFLRSAIPAKELGQFRALRAREGRGSIKKTLEVMGTPQCYPYNMATLLLLALLVFLILGILVLIKATKKKHVMEGLYTYSDHRRKSFFRKRAKVFNQSEEALFLELLRHIPSGWRVFPKIRIADIIETTNGKGYKRLLYKILSKHIDFLLVDENFSPRIAIELQGNSHRKSDRKKSDEIKKEVFSAIGIPLAPILVGSTFSEVVPELIAKAQ